MTAACTILIGISALALCACQGLNLDPESHHAFAKANATETTPPADLLLSVPGLHYIASR
jgi:hypothetical protein